MSVRARERERRARWARAVFAVVLVLVFLVVAAGVWFGLAWWAAWLTEHRSDA